jgi:predicted esterase
VIVALLAACGGEEGGPTEPSVHTDTGTTPPESGPTSPWTGPMPVGTWLLNLSVVPLGGLPVPFQVEIAGAEGSGVLDSMAIRGVALSGAVSPDLVVLGPIALDETGAFELSVDEILIPAAYTITGSDVTVQLELAATVASDASFCGTVDGMITSMSLPLTGSTFGTKIWDGDLSGPLSCDPPATTGIPRITDCPDILGGENVDFPSGGDNRSFEVVVPAQYDPGTAWPVVFAFHGYGGSPASMLDADSDLRPYADERGVILVAPLGIETGGYTLWDVFGGEATNKDLAFFDDLLTCVSESFTVDPARVHATGMSFGGLMTGALLAHRSSVLASAAPLSGGILTTFPAQGLGGPPALVVWGGESDISQDQDFDLLAQAMIGTLQGNDQFVVACDHGLGHELSSDFWPWVMDFFGDHPLGIDAEPYAAGLPPSFPAYCVVPSSG